jgi:hypothetical protein
MIRIDKIIVSLSIFSTSLIIPVNAQTIQYFVYPYLYDTMPDIESPGIMRDSVEVMLVETKDGKYGIVPVTIEKGTPLFYGYRVGTHLGKDNQLRVSAEFLSLVETGLHSEGQLVKTRRITGIPVDIINCTAKPNGYSYSGFIAADEDIISVLKGDNRVVKELGLVHADMARPLFHIWNLILIEIELGNWGRFYNNIQKIYYNGNILNFSAIGYKGWQNSIFNDEIQGRYDIHIDRVLTQEEVNYLNEKYSHLNHDEKELLIKKLTTLNFSEMLPYYIMQYGFYEGHTDYRCDPAAIAFIFGLRSMEEIGTAFNEDLFNLLTTHYTAD